MRLVEAAKHRDRAAVRALLEEGVDVNAPQGDGATALHWAAHWDDLATAELLLRANANVRIANELGVTPLALACTNGSAGMVARLLRAGADPNGSTGVRPPPLMECSRTGNVEAVRLLLDAGAAVNAVEPARDQTALMWAASERHPAIVRLLLERRADVHARSRKVPLFINRGDPNDRLSGVIGEIHRGGSSALLFAARVGDVQSVSVLLAAGAKIDDVAADGASALILAAHGNHEGVASLLLERGANANIIGPGYTALHAAVLRGNASVVRKLVAKGANVNSRVRHGTPATRGSLDFHIPETLTGATSVFLAAKFLKLDILRALRAAGSDPSIALPDGTTPLMVAAGVMRQGPLFDRRDRVQPLTAPDEVDAANTVALLLSTGAAVNAQNQGGDTALHGAAAHRYHAVMRLLASHGAMLDVRNRQGKTPMSIADAKTAEVLQQLGATK